MNQIEKKFNITAKFLSAAVFFIGLAALAGWIFNIETLKSIFPGAVAIKANTAICFILTGIALLIYPRTNNPENSLTRTTIKSCALIISLFGIATFFEYVSGLDFGLDQLFFKESEDAIFTSSPGRMAFNTAINFVLIGISLFFLTSKKIGPSWLIQMLAILISFSGFLSFVGYLYHANPVFIGLYYSTAMALHAAIAFILFGAALLFSTSGGITNIIAGQGAGSQMFRRILPIAILIPLILGRAKLELISKGLISDELSTALIVILNICLIIIYLVILSFFMNKEDEKQKQAELELMQNNRILRILSSINEALIRAKDETSLLNETCRIVKEIGGYRMLWIGYKENNKEKSIRPAAYAGFESGYLEAAHISWGDTERGHGPAGIAIRTGKLQIIQDIATEPLMAPWRKMAMERSYRSAIILPLKNNEQTFGALFIYADRTSAFSPNEIKILSELANNLAFGITSLRINIEHELLEKELLKASTDRYKALFVSSRDAIMTLEPPSWKFTSGNPAAVAMFKTKNEGAFLNHEPWVFSPELQSDGRSSAEKAKEMIDKAMRTGSNFFEWTHKRLTGEEFPAEVLLSKIEQKGKIFLHATVRDITERKKLEGKIKEYAEEKFKIIFNNTNDGMILADPKNTKFVLVNSAICQMLGYTPKELKILFVADIHPKKDLPYVLEQFNRLAKGELKIAINIPIKRKDDSIFFADVSASIVTIENKKYLLGVFRDITERKQAEEALKKSEKMFSALAQSSPDCIKQFDLDGNLVFINNGGLEEHGFKNIEEAKKRGVLETIIPEDRIKSKKAFSQAAQGKPSSAEIRHTPEGSNRKCCLEMFTPIRDEKNMITGVLGVSRDITKRIQTEEELKKTVERLKELDKLKDNFLNVTTHELKAPLVPISSQTQLLLSGNYGKINKKQQEALEMILRNERSLNRLTGDVLDIAKIKSRKFKLILQKSSLGKAIAETVKNLEKTAEEKQTALFLLPIPKLPQITIDEKRIVQVLSNLLDNALKFTPEKGKIEIKVRKEKNNIIVTVKDTGIGLSRENIKKLFTPFFQVESDLARKYRGTGLGLAICKGIIETHGGRIWAESQGEGKGASFSFSLPVKKE